MVGVTLAAPVVIPALALAMVAQKDRPAAAGLLGTLAVAAGMTGLFYYLGMRERPAASALAPADLRLLLPSPGLPSFPSGHAALAFAAAAYIGLRTKHTAILAMAVVLAMLVAFSRVYVGHHYPSDILAGAILGSTVGAAGYGLMRTHGKTIPEQMRWLVWPQIGLVVLVTMMAYLGILPRHLLAWPHADKVLHFLLFGAVAFWLNLWMGGRVTRIPLPGSRKERSRPVPVAVLIPLVLAAVEEGIQVTSPHRTGSPADLGADLLGLLLFWRLSEEVRMRAQRRRKITSATDPERPQKAPAKRAGCQ